MPVSEVRLSCKMPVTVTKTGADARTASMSRADRADAAPPGGSGRADYFRGGGAAGARRRHSSAIRVHSRSSAATRSGSAAARFLVSQRSVARS